MTATGDNFPLLAELLSEQQRLDTPVARFASAHDTGTTDAWQPQLLPLSRPGPGEQYAFEVDLDACTGCKSCVAACHSLNGLDEEETWRDVGLLVGSNRRHPFTQTVTTACHHCADPGCLNGCPVLAYEKDPLTGIVRHLDDQCIGCSYCVLKCPYDVPKYSHRLGIVRKCDMCHGRLAHGEAPACAQACPTHAIRIVTVATAAPSTAFLPVAPDPSYTRPTTRYVSKRGIPADVIAADTGALRPQPAHWPLVFLLTLMPLAVGCSGLAACLDAPAVTRDVALVGWVAGAIGLVASVLHLGQPKRAWRIFLGLRRSWLSREAVLFGAWFGLASAALASRLLSVHWLTVIGPEVHVASAVVGTLGLFSSVMIYADTRRQFWRVGYTGPRFFGTAVLLTLSVTLVCCALAAQLATASSKALGIILALATAAKLALEARALEPLNGDRDTVTPTLTTARLLAGPLRPVNELRVACAVGGGMIVPLLVTTIGAPTWLVVLALAAVVSGEILERSLFFRAVDAPRMPGMPA